MYTRFQEWSIALNDHASNTRKSPFGDTQETGLQTWSVEHLNLNTQYWVSEFFLVEKIFKIKKRPSKNPLIIHYYDTKGISKDIIINKRQSCQSY